MDTRLDEIADGMFRISTGVPIPAIPGGFSFNQAENSASVGTRV